jgi:biotin carboxyl carrier protein
MKDYKYKINGNDYKVSIGDIENNIAHVEVNGVPYNVEIQETKAAPVTVKTVKPAAAPRTETGAKVINKPTVATGQAAIKSPLPGVIIDIKVKVGDTVTSSTVVAVLEAMKMENNINAGKDGVVKAINVNKGDSVLEGSDLLVIE